MMFVDMCMTGAEKLREIAAQFDALGQRENADCLRDVADRHEILAGAYMTSTGEAK